MRKILAGTIVFAAAAVSTGPAFATGWTVAIEQGPMTTTCGGSSIPVAGATDCTSAVSAAQALFAALKQKGCVSEGCKAGETAQPITPTCTEQNFTRPNGAPGKRWQVSMDFTCTASSAKKGMTWVHLISDPVHGTVTVGCNAGATNQADHCNAYVGDMACTASKPLLCIYGGKTSPAGAGLFPKPPSVNGSGQYNRWSGGLVATTTPMVGTSITSLAAANARCVAEFGNGWRWAEFHDGWGWNFQAYGGTTGAPNVGPAERFWVYINDKPANCF